LRDKARPTDRLAIACAVVGAVVLIARISEPARRVPWVGSNGFSALMLPILLDFLTLAAVALLAVIALYALPRRLRTLDWFRATRPLLILGLLFLAAWYLPWERLYWTWHWRSNASGYDAAMRAVRSGEAPLLGQLEAFPMAYGSVARLPERYAKLGLWGRAVVQRDSTDSLAVLFMTSAWWTDNWAGYVYMARPHAEPVVFSGVYFVRRRLTPHWWFVEST
jgi:hypothetical protein